MKNCAQPVLKIGIPVLNRGDLLRRLVDSVDVDAEILVVVNSIGAVDPSVEDTAGMLEAQDRPGVRVRVERIAGNLGVAGSWNLILDRFGGDCVISNSDIEFAPGFLRQAMVRIDLGRDIVMHHLWAASCFYVTAEFPATLGWFDENIYPAYHEDQEINMRSAALDIRRAIVSGVSENGIFHGLSQTRKNASEAVQTYIRKAKARSCDYLTRRWGPTPARGTDRPVKSHPFDDPTLHPADWTLDLDARRTVAALCKEVTGFDCPIVYHRTKGGLSKCS
jgi:GT2 family glycosyltransferase